ncbi:uncharacterized mitochondrial protein AtMg00820-like [Humulus lupulus]|uniref:uncharacterized mitochondrial protein AtMg00820-like n=1 Tax=Humulus lupulus TaxID=3486 RepID=UPI002B404E88|nr:uncharacterized mitochondrial protein AtMg00820-like [Humulus lupulus]
MVTRAKSGIHKPRLFYNVAAGTPIEPSTYREASKYDEWNHSMHTEFTALQSQGTWSLVPFPANCKVIGSKWVYRIKLKADGSVNRYKARLVAKGSHQTLGLDFHETCSLVIKPTTI